MRYHWIWVVAAVSCARAGADPEEGARISASVCARCHGADGRGGLAQGPVPAPRNFRDPTFQTARTDADLKRVIRLGKGGFMPSFADTFTDAQIDSLVAVVRAFDPGRNR